MRSNVLLTKWPEAYAIHNQEAATVARMLCDFFYRFGMPQELHSKQGRNFESAVFRECCQLLGITKTRTTSLHPQSDGMVDRFIRTLTDGLAKMCSAGQDDWYEILPSFLMAYRSAVPEPTGYKPSRLMLGRELRLPADLLMGHPPSGAREVCTTQFACSLRDSLETVLSHVPRNIGEASTTMKLRADSRPKSPLLSPAIECGSTTHVGRKAHSSSLISR